MLDLTAARQGPYIAASPLVRPLAPATRLVLRGDSEVMAAALAAIGLPFTETACRAVSQDGRSALWLGPDERLLLCGQGEPPGLARLREALAGRAHSLVDVSHRQCALEVSGAQAPVLLNCGCPLDLDQSAFPMGMCTRTVLGKAQIVLWRTGERTFHLEVWRSFAAYVSKVLALAARELQL